jgi:hypothetical protein
MSALRVNSGTGNQRFDGGSSIAQQLAAPPFWIFADEIDHVLDVAIERSQRCAHALYYEVTVFG